MNIPWLLGLAWILPGCVTSPTNHGQEAGTTPSGPPAHLQCKKDEPSDLDCFIQIPAGTYTIGAQASDPSSRHHDPAAAADEGPVHDIQLDAFWIQRLETHASSFHRCAEAGECPKDSIQSEGSLYNFGKELRGEHPINGVTWAGAAAYCAFLGGRLPTEAEWEVAARGADARRWPWGNQPGCGVRADESTAVWNLEQADEETCSRLGTAVSRDLRGESPFGLVGMAGNVAEWVTDWYAEDAYAQAAPRGPEEGVLRVVRGGSWLDSDPTLLRSAARAGVAPDSKLPDIGFRCAW